MYVLLNAKLKVFTVIMVLSTLFVGSNVMNCSAKDERLPTKVSNIQCPILAGPPGAQWWRQLDRKEEFVKVTVEKYNGPHKYFWRGGGATLFEIPEENGVNGNAVEVSKKAYQQIILDSGKDMVLIMYKAPGSKARWTYVPEWNGLDIYQRTGEGKGVKVGEHKCDRTLYANEAGEHILCLSKGLVTFKRWVKG